jgi:hypothetical protein
VLILEIFLQPGELEESRAAANPVREVLKLHLKSHDWAKRDSQIIVAAIVEIDFVSNFKTQAYGADAGLDSAGRVESGVQVRGANIEDRARHIRVGKQAGTQAEI